MHLMALEQLHTAVLNIATSRAIPGDRLFEAAAHHLAAIDTAHLPDRETAAWVHRILDRVTARGQPPGACPIRSGVAKLADDEVDGLLIEIVDLYEDLARQDAMRRTRQA